MAGVLDMELGELGARVRAGFGWWTDELAAMAAPLLRPIGGRRPDLVAVAQGEGFALYREGRLAGRADPARPAAVALALPETVALVRETPAPGLSERDWRRILLDEIDRLTPFAAEEVYAALTFSGDGDARMARLTVAPRRRLDARLGEARAGGVAPTALLAAAPDGGAVDLMAAVRSAGGAASASPTRTWWAAVALLLVLNLAAAVWRDVAQTQRLEAAAADVQPAADRVRRLREGLDAEGRRRLDLLTRRAAGDPLASLATLTRALPQGAFVDHFTLQGGAVRLAGRRGVDVDVAGAMRAGGFRQVRDVSADLAPPVPDAAHAVPFDLSFQTPAVGRSR